MGKLPNGNSRYFATVQQPLGQGCPNFLLGGPHAVRWTSAGAACLKKMYSLFFFKSGPRHAPQERKRRSCVVTIDIIYICSCIRVYNVFGRNSTPSFSLGPDSKKRASTFFWDTRGRGPDSFHKFKSSRGPDKILSQARFGPRAGLWTCLP